MFQVSDRESDKSNPKSPSLQVSKSPNEVHSLQRHDRASEMILYPLCLPAQVLLLPWAIKDLDLSFPHLNLEILSQSEINFVALYYAAADIRPQFEMSLSSSSSSVKMAPGVALTNTLLSTQTDHHYDKPILPKSLSVDKSNSGIMFVEINALG